MRIFNNIFIKKEQKENELAVNEHQTAITDTAKTKEVNTNNPLILDSHLKSDRIAYLRKGGVNLYEEFFEHSFSNVGINFNEVLKCEDKATVDSIRTIQRSIILQTLLNTYSGNECLIQMYCYIKCINKKEVELVNIDLNYFEISSKENDNCIAREGLKYIQKNDVLRLIEISKTYNTNIDLNCIDTLPVADNGCIELPLFVLNEILIRIDEQELKGNDIMLRDILRETVK